MVTFKTINSNSCNQNSYQLGSILISLKINFFVAFPIQTTVSQNLNSSFQLKIINQLHNLDNQFVPSPYPSKAANLLCIYVQITAIEKLLNLKDNLIRLSLLITIIYSFFKCFKFIFFKYIFVY